MFQLSDPFLEWSSFFLEILSNYHESQSRVLRPKSVEQLSQQSQSEHTLDEQSLQAMKGPVILFSRPSGLREDSGGTIVSRHPFGIGLELEVSNNLFVDVESGGAILRKT